MSDIILHHFDASPFGLKVRLMLGLKALSWRSVDAELIMPKPKLTALTGGYRKTPVMQIGADIYCDSRMIAIELERRHPTPTLFPAGSRGTCLALASWSDRDLHIASSGLAIGVNKSQFPEALMEDRKAYFGDFMDIDRIDTEVPHLMTQLRAHADLIEQQLADGRAFWFGDEPSLADFHAYVEILTVRAHVPSASALLHPFEAMTSWEKRVAGIGTGHRTDISADEANAIARESAPEAGSGVDDADPLGLPRGSLTTVVPDDYGREPVVGRLVTLSTHEVAVEREDPVTGTVTVHFPRIGFRVEPVQSA